MCFVFEGAAPVQANPAGGPGREATNPHETVVEREYILDETKTLFRYRYIPRDTVKDL